MSNLLNPSLVVPAESLAVYRTQVDEWRTSELPARRTRWVQTAGRESLRFMALSFLRHTFTVRWRPDLEPLAVRTDLRRELVNKLCGSTAPDALADHLLEHGATYPSLLSAAIAATSEHATGETEKRAVTRVMRG